MSDIFDQSRFAALVNTPGVATAEAMPSWAYVASGSQTEFFQFISRAPGQLIKLNADYEFYIKPYTRNGEVLGRFVTNNPVIAEMARALCGDSQFAVFNEERLILRTVRQLQELLPRATNNDVALVPRVVPLAPESQVEELLPRNPMPQPASYIGNSLAGVVQGRATAASAPMREQSSLLSELQKSGAIQPSMSAAQLSESLAAADDLGDGVATPVKASTPAVGSLSAMIKGAKSAQAELVEPLPE